MGSCPRPGLIHNIDDRVRIQRSDDRSVIELVMGASVPEIGKVEHGIDRRRRIAGFSAAHIHTRNIENLIQKSLSFVKWLSPLDIIEACGKDTLGRGHVVGVEDHI